VVGWLLEDVGWGEVGVGEKEDEDGAELEEEGAETVRRLRGRRGPGEVDAGLVGKVVLRRGGDVVRRRDPNRA